MNQFRSDNVTHTKIPNFIASYRNKRTWRWKIDKIRFCSMYVLCSCTNFKIWLSSKCILLYMMNLQRQQILRIFRLFPKIWAIIFFIKIGAVQYQFVVLHFHIQFDSFRFILGSKRKKCVGFPIFCFFLHKMLIAWRNTLI